MPYIKMSHDYENNRVIMISSEIDAMMEATYNHNTHDINVF